MYIYSVKNYCEFNSNIYGTRNRNDSKINFQRLNICKRSVFHNPSNSFSKLSVDVANMKSISSFEQSVKHLLTENQL